MRTHWIIPPLCLVLGFAAGFSQSESSSPNESKSDVARETPSSTKLGARPVDIRLQDDRRKELVKQLKSIGFLPSRVQIGAALSELLDSLSFPDLKLASELLEQLPSSFQSEAKLLFALRFLEVDPQEAARFVQSRCDVLDNLSLLFIREWQRRDPKAAISWFTQLPDKRVGIGRQFVASATLRKWASEEPQRAAELVMSSPDLFGVPGVHAAFGSWAKHNPQEAMEGAMALNTTYWQQVAMRAALKNWVQQDPESAFQWYAQISDGSVQSQLAEEIAVGLAAQNRGQSIELLRALPEGRVRDVALVKVAESFRGSALEESLDLADEIPFDPANAALKNYYEGLYSENAGAAFNRLFQRLERAVDPAERQAIEKFLRVSVLRPMLDAEGITKALIDTPATAANPLRLDMLDGIAGRWAGTNPADARKWLGSLPPGEARDRVIAGVTAGWAYSAQSEAAAWIDQQSPSASRDAAVRGFVKQTLNRDPSASLARLRTMRNTEAQLATLVTVWRDWARRDRAAAEAWLKTSPDLNSAERSALNSSGAR